MTAEQQIIRQRYRQPALAVVGLLLALGLVGCASEQERRQTWMLPSADRGEPPPESAGKDRDPQPDDGGGLDTSLDRGAGAGGGDVEKFRGTGEFVNRDVAERGPPPEIEADGEINLNFEGLPVQEVVRAVLGDLLGENYVIAPGVSGEVTFATARPISREQVLPILEMLLRWNNAAMVYKDGRYHVVPVSNAVRGKLAPRIGDPGSVRGYEVLAVPLDYIAPTQMQTILQPYVQDGAILSADNARSLVVLAGTRSELRTYLQTIEMFDVNWLEGMSVGMFSLERVEIDEVVPELQAVFGEEGESPLAGMFRFVPIQRLNAVMVITQQPQYLDQAERWIRRLDRTAAGAGTRLFVYRVENLEATVLAGYLADIFGGDGGGARRGGDDGGRAGRLSPGLEPTTVSSFNEQTSGEADTGEPDQQQPGGTGGVSLGDTEDVRITAVEETNSLLIQSSPQQYDAILSAIKRLDTEPLQVLLQAQVLEVALTGDLQYGVQWFLSRSRPGEDAFPGLPGGGGDGSGSGFVADPDASNALIGGSQNIFSFADTFGGDPSFVSGVINALESVSDVRSLSAPSLLVRNNTEATVNVGDQIPVTSTSFNTNQGGTGTFQNTQFIETGTTLSVTPRINPGGLVYLQITQTVSTPGPRDPNTGNPPINNREITTEVAVQSGQTVILGGLIQDQTSVSEDGLPGLRRIPLLGNLFGSRNVANNRTELIVLITPRVVESIDRLQQVSDELRKEFKGLEPFKKPVELPDPELLKD